MLLNHQEVYLPKYDMSGTTKRFDNHCLAKTFFCCTCRRAFYLNRRNHHDIFDFKIYVDIDREVQKKTFLERAKQRDLVIQRIKC